MSYESTLASVETYFDKTATTKWERLTSDAPVSKIRETVRKGRDQMRDQLRSRLPADLQGVRILDAGCGTGQMAQELAMYGADVVAIDISPSLVDIARQRMPQNLQCRVTFKAGDMLSKELGHFDHVIAMDSLIYYSAPDLAEALDGLAARTRESVLFTVAPRTPMLMAMWHIGKLFPRSDRSPTMVPHTAPRLSKALFDQRSAAHLCPLNRVTSGFYISQAMELTP